MKRNYNRQIFDTSNEKWKEKYDAFMNVLLEDDDNTYNDIHVYREDFFVTIEWCQVPYNHEYGGQFRFVDDDECVMIDKKLPDGTGIYVNDEEEWREVLETWLKENPGWHKDFYECWVYEEPKNN